MRIAALGFACLLAFGAFLQGGAALAQDRAGWPTALAFGVIPNEGSVDLTQRFQPLFTHLEQSLKLTVKPLIGADFAAVVIAMSSKKIDLAYFGPAAYIQAAERANAEAFAKIDTLKGGTGYNALIIAKAGGPIKSLEDARGQDFAFVDPNSTSGYLVPLSYFLQERKVKPEDYFKRLVFAGSHEAAMLAVANGRIPAAATSNLDLDRAIEKGVFKGRDEFTVLWQSPLIPGSPLAYRKDLPLSLRTALRDAVLAFKDPKGLETLQIKGFVAAQDQEYDPIRRLELLKKQLGK